MLLVAAALGVAPADVAVEPATGEPTEEARAAAPGMVKAGCSSGSACGPSRVRLWQRPQAEQNASEIA
jgi:hypothetical protein